LRVTEVPITYHPRLGHSKLRRWRDGARHVRFMLAEALRPHTRGATTARSGAPTNTTASRERQGPPDASAGGADSSSTNGRGHHPASGLAPRGAVAPGSPSTSAGHGPEAPRAEPSANAAEQ
jgi:hypothetical protein